MKITHILGAILFGFGVYCSAASMVAKLPEASLEVRIYNDRPCKLVEDPAAKGADVTFSGKHLDACWKPVEGGVAILDEEGDSGVLPVQLFQKDPEV